MALKNKIVSAEEAIAIVRDGDVRKAAPNHLIVAPDGDPALAGAECEREDA